MNEQKRLFESLYRDYQPMVMQMCLGFMKGDRAPAADLTQEVFVNTWTALDNFKGESSHKTWLYRITVNTCLQYIRKERRRMERESATNLGQETNNMVDDRHTALYQAIGKLEEIDRLIITMVLDEVEYSEIATVMGIRENNLRVRVHRIKEKLKERIAHE